MAKAKSWAQVRKEGANARKFFVSATSAGSAWSTLQRQNDEFDGGLAGLVRRKQEEKENEEEDEEGKAQPVKKAPRKPTASKVTKPSRKKKGAATKTSRKPSTSPDDDPQIALSSSNKKTNKKPAEPESWRLCGDETAPDPEPSATLGLARIATWQYEKFTTEFKRLLEEYGCTEVELDGEVLDAGGEKVMDVRATFVSEDEASTIKDVIDGVEIGGRKLQVRFAGA